MFERSELRSRREVRMENGVKNLKGSEAVSQNLSQYQSDFFTFSMVIPVYP